MESHFELRFEKHILPYLRALTQAERTAAFVIIPHLFILCEQEVGKTGIILLFWKESRPRWKL